MEAAPCEIVSYDCNNRATEWFRGGAPKAALSSPSSAWNNGRLSMGTGRRSTGRAPRDSGHAPRSRCVFRVGGVPCQ
jgi:hypothetical protein